MEEDLDGVLLDGDRIARRVRELGEAISRDMDALGPDAEIVLIPVLTGSMIFVADLLRTLPQKIRLGVVTVRSYPGTATTSRGPSITHDLLGDLSEKHVLIVDDILDSGRTLQLLRGEIEAHGPRSIRTCVFLRKDRPAARETPCDYVGFEIPDRFVVGYGLDYNGYYRNLPYVGTLKPGAL